ncbi:MAG: Cof-type HAD-IIB family hydrolase [Propionibacteriaceae bacterium]|nr:Cof-type HAD-IIB family hydrolase [Propionibacteriaceae bacterium]
MNLEISPELANRVQLIASDLDGTMLYGHSTFSPRVKSAVSAAHAAGIQVVAATGRAVSYFPDALRDIEVRYAIASNGAVGYDLKTNDVLFATYLEAQVIAKIVDYLTDICPGVTFGSSQDAGATMLVEQDYYEFAMKEDNYPPDFSLQIVEIAEIMSKTAVKFTARHPQVTSDELFEALEKSDIDGYTATTSGAPFVEIAAHGVDKSTGIAKLCKALKIPREGVVTVGDARNDINMIQWAAYGAAMADAAAQTKAAADGITASNKEDGVAVLIEKILQARTV